MNFSVRYVTVPRAPISKTPIAIGDVINDVIDSSCPSVFKTWRLAKYYEFDIAETKNVRLNITKMTFPFILRILKAEMLNPEVEVIHEVAKDIREENLPIFHEEILGPGKYFIEVAGFKPKSGGSFEIETY